MKTLKSILIISAFLFSTGSAFASGKGPGDENNTNVIREKIASAIGSSDILGKGEVTLKFGVTDKNALKILKVESPDKNLSNEVKKALMHSEIKFPEGSRGFYEIKVHVNESGKNKTIVPMRQQVVDALSELDSYKSELVKVKFRALYPNRVEVLKVESSNRVLASEVKKAIENRTFDVPQNFNGQYNFNITFK